MNEALDILNNFSFDFVYDCLVTNDSSNIYPGFLDDEEVADCVEKEFQFLDFDHSEALRADIQVHVKG